MKIINDADYYRIVTTTAHYEAGSALLEEARKELSIGNDRQQRRAKLLISLMSKEQNGEMMSLLGFLRSVGDDPYSLAPEAIGVIDRHMMKGRIFIIARTAQLMSDGPVKTTLKYEYEKLRRLLVGDEGASA